MKKLFLINLLFFQEILAVNEITLDKQPSQSEQGNQIIEDSQRASSKLGLFSSGPDANLKFPFVCKINPNDEHSLISGLGTGVYIGNKLVLTAYHVVEEEMLFLSRCTDGFKNVNYGRFIWYNLPFVVKSHMRIKENFQFAGVSAIFGHQQIKIEKVLQYDDASDVALLRLETDPENILPASLEIAPPTSQSMFRKDQDEKGYSMSNSLNFVYPGLPNEFKETYKEEVEQFIKLAPIQEKSSDDELIQKMPDEEFNFYAAYFNYLVPDTKIKFTNKKPLFKELTVAGFGQNHSYRVCESFLESIAIYKDYKQKNTFSNFTCRENFNPEKYEFVENSVLVLKKDDEVQNKVFSFSKIQKIKNTIKPVQTIEICTEFPLVGPGDSGGPLIVGGKVIGILSTSETVLPKTNKKENSFIQRFWTNMKKKCQNFFRFGIDMKNDIMPSFRIDNLDGEFQNDIHCYDQEWFSFVARKSVNIFKRFQLFYKKQKYLNARLSFEKCLVNKVFKQKKDAAYEAFFKMEKEYHLYLCNAFLSSSEKTRQEAGAIYNTLLRKNSEDKFAQKCFTYRTSYRSITPEIFQWIESHKSIVIQEVDGNNRIKHHASDQQY